MKHRSLALTILIVAVLVVEGLVSATAAQPEQWALVKVAWSGPDDLVQVEASDLVVYACLSGDGGPYLLAGGDPDMVKALRAEGLDVAVLDPDMAGASYYLIYPAPGRPDPDWDAYGLLLLDDGVQILLRMSAQDATRLAMTGVQLRALSLDPKPLWPAPVERTWPTAVEPSPLVQAMIDQVDATTLYSYTGGLSGEWAVEIAGEPYTITTRFTDSGQPIQKATQFVGEHLATLGLDVEYHTWTATRPPNVIGELRGRFNPDQVIILCAHLDSITYKKPKLLAPGADDNASGSTAILAAADILSQYPWGCTLRFALWTGEEQGLLGSHAYAQRAYYRGEAILGVLNLDMIAWDKTGGPDMDLHANQAGNPDSMQLAQLFADVVDAYDLDLIPEIIPSGTGQSDHASFWDYGYTAILGIEDYYPGGQDFNPYYHTEEDQLEHLNLDYLTEFVKASVGTFGHMGCLLPHGILTHYLPLVVRGG